MTAIDGGALTLLRGDVALGASQAEVIVEAYGPPSLPAADLRQPVSRFRTLRLCDGGVRGFLLHYAPAGEGVLLGLEPTDWMLGFLDHVHSSIAVSDERGRICYANPTLLTLFAVPLTELIGMPAGRLAARIASQEGDIAALRSAAADGRDTGGTLVAVLPGQRRVTLRVHGSPFRYRGLACGMIWSLFDATGAEDGQRQAALALSFRLAAMLQHELRNPLQTIQAAVEILRPWQAESGLHTLELLEQQIQVISDYLAERLQPPGPAMLARGLLSEVVAEEVQRSSLRMITRRLRFIHERPAAEPPVRLHPGSLGRAFANLFRNSAQARPDATITIRYEVGVHTVTCTVDDNGPGFPPHMLHGRWLSAWNNVIEHLGLAIVASTVEAHGGDLVLENGPSGGARVRVSLPVAASGVEARTEVAIGVDLGH